MKTKFLKLMGPPTDCDSADTRGRRYLVPVTDGLMISQRVISTTEGPEAKEEVYVSIDGKGSIQVYEDFETVKKMCKRAGAKIIEPPMQLSKVKKAVVQLFKKDR